MKKLMVAIGAAAVAFGLYAEKPASSLATSFESGDAEVETTFTAAGWTGLTDPVTLGAYADDRYAYGEGAYVRRNEYFDSTKTAINQESFLPLETGNAVVSHAIAGNDNGIVYVDQLVKFTGFEEMQTDLGDSKIAVWFAQMDADPDTGYEGETNLYVTAAKIGAESTIAQPYKINKVAKAGDELPVVKDGEWHRITIKSLGNIRNSGTAIAGFTVYVDGIQVGSSDAEGCDEGDTKFAKLNDEGLLFPAFKPGLEFASVGYKGIGAIDDVIADTEGPKFASTVDFTFAALTDAEITAVKDADGNPIPFADNKYTAAVDATIKVTVAALGHKLFDVDGVGTKEITIDVAAKDGEIDINDQVETVDAKACIGNTDYLSLEAAIAAAQNGNTVTVLGTISVKQAINVNANITLDLGGKTVAGAWNTGISGVGDRRYIFELGNSAVTVTNGTVRSSSNNIGAFHTVGGSLTLGEGAIVNTKWRAVGAYDGATVVVGADASLTSSDEDPTIFIWAKNGSAPCNVTINGTVKNTFAGPRTCDNLDAVIMGSGNDQANGVALTVNEGAVIQGTICSGIYFPCKGDLTINGGTIEGREFGVYAKAGNIAIKGGEITSTATEVTAITAYGNGVKGAGNAVVVEKNAGYAGFGTVAITGGKFTSVGPAVVAFGAGAPTGFIAGGLFKAIPDVALIQATAGATAEWINDDTEAGYVKPSSFVAVAKIEDQKFATLQEAVDAGAGETVTLLADVTLDARIEVADSMTIDLGGKTITTTKTCGNAGTAFNVTAGTVTIQNGTIDGSKVDCAAVPDGEVDTILARSGATVNLNLNVVIDTKNGACAYAFNGGKINITGGSYANVTGDEYEYKNGVKGMPVNQANVADQLVTISGGKFRQQNPADGDDAGLCTTFLAEGKKSVLVGEWYEIADKAQIALTITADNATVTGIENGTVLEGSNLTFTVVANPDYTLKSVKINDEEKGTTGSYTYEVTGNETAGALEIVVTVEAAQPEIVPVDPEQPIDPEDQGKTAEELIEEMNATGGTVKPEYIKIPEMQTATDQQKADYAQYFKAVATADGKVEIELNEAGTNALKDVAATIETAVATELPEIVGAAAGEEVDVVIPPASVKPGFYYGIAATPDLNALKTAEPNEWVQAKGEGVTLKAKKPDTGNAAFFQTKVTVKPAK